MGHPDLKESDLVIDLESGGTTSEEEGSRNLSSSGTIPSKKTLGRAWSGFVGLDGSIRSADSVSICKSELYYGRISGNCVESLGEEEMEFMRKKMNKEKWKKLGSKKAPKPPRPPRGPSLDAADMKMVREISELAMMKRARVERVKALKMKMEKASSSASSINFIAMIITILFCFILIFQGICSGSSSSNMSFHGSPETAGDSLISIKHSVNPPASSAESVPLQQATALQDGRRISRKVKIFS